MSDDNSWIRAFSAKLDELRDFPDMSKMNNIVHIASQQLRLAKPFVDCVIAKLIDASTPPAYRKPLFYAIDAIMKHVGGPYNGLFAQQLSEKFPMTVRDISEIDRVKLEAMVGFWEERNYFAPELIMKMRNRLRTMASSSQVSCIFQLLRITLTIYICVAGEYSISKCTCDYVNSISAFATTSSTQYQSIGTSLVIYGFEQLQLEQYF